VLSCIQTVTQTHERLPITTACLSCSQHLGVAASSASDHQCNGAITRLANRLARTSCAYCIVCAIFMLPQQPCSRSGAWRAVGLLITGMLCVLVTLM